MGYQTHLHCDNQAVVCFAVGQSKGSLGTCTRSIWLWAATHDIDLNYVHVMCKYNRANNMKLYEIPSLSP